MVTLVMLVIMLGCAALLYLKGNLMQGLTLVFNALIGGFVALGFFEMLADQLTKYSPGIAAWAQMICFLLLFVLAFGLLQAAVSQVFKDKMDLGLWPERVGRVVCGIFLGYVVMGNLLIAVAAAPLPSKYPYPRFDERNPDPARPNKALFNPDGFVSSLFGMVSRGSLGAMMNGRSFAMLHAGFVDQLYLNRHKALTDAPMATDVPALDVPRKNGVWEAPASLRDSDGNTLPARPGETLMLVRIGIRKRALKDAGQFTLSQLRLVCGPQGDRDAALRGSGQAVYPIGYIGTSGHLDSKPLSEKIVLKSEDVKGDVQQIDFAFYVPINTTPLLVEFKRNNVAELSAPASADEAPKVIPFGGTAPPAKAAPEDTEPPSQSRDN